MVKTKLVKEQPVRSMAKNANNLLTHSSLKVSIQTNKQMTNPFLKLDFLFEFCFSLHGMQYVLLSHTGKYYFNFSGSMVPHFHGTAESFSVYKLYFISNCISQVHYKNSNECCTFPYLLLFFILMYIGKTKQKLEYRLKHTKLISCARA